MMLAATALLYPCVLVALCLGAGLLVDRAAGSYLAAPILLPVGAAALIAVSQLLSVVGAIAPASPFALGAVALAGLTLGRSRAASLLAGVPRHPGAILVSAFVYLIAIAPVLLAGRASFSSFMALSDSAVHMIGADYLVRHGQSFAHLDLRNSYGQFINDYYNSGYPSGADTLFGASSSLLGLPLIWSFQPFNAFMLAIAAGPAWTLARRMGLAGAWAGLAAMCCLLAALVYAYELLGSVKELTALAMILTLGALLVCHRDWLARAPNRAIPCALVIGAGVSALGVAFGAWALVAALVLAAVMLAEIVARRRTLREALSFLAAGTLSLLIVAWPTWRGVSRSLTVAEDIASTSNPGNLHSPLHATQALGVWLGGSYKLQPTGSELTLTHVLMAITVLAAVLGAAHLLRIRAVALAGWVALMLLAWLLVTHFVTTWAGAKTLMLTSPALVLLAWGGVAALRSLPARGVALPAAALLALALTGGVLASDAMQYHSANLAPTARYEELASLAHRFAGRGPAVFTDFDEYSLYLLRDLDLAGPDFAYPPASLAPAAGGYGQPVDLDRLAPSALVGYRLIITRRDPAASRPPAAYRLRWLGAFYEVWERSPAAPVALSHLALQGDPASQCRSIGALAGTAGASGARLIVDQAPALVAASLASATRPRRWGHQRQSIVMSTAGRLSATVRLPTAGRWNLWLQGELMPSVAVSIDGRLLGSPGGQLSGNSLVPDTLPPLALELAAGVHRVSVTRSGFTLAPGEGGAAVLEGILFTPSAASPQGSLRSAAPTRWRSLCGRSYHWVELVPRARA